MMTCKEVKTLVDEAAIGNTAMMDRADEHAADCLECRETLALERLSRTLIGSYCALPEDGFEPPPYWSTRLMARIHEMKEQSVSSWEAAIMGLRGWITGLAAVALVLIAASLQGPYRAADASAIGYTEFEEMGQSGTPEELISVASDQVSKSGNLYE